MAEPAGIPKGGEGRGGGHPTSYIRPEGFVYCLSKDRFLQCQDGILLLNLKYVRLTELKSFLSIFRDQCKKKNASTPVEHSLACKHVN